MSPHQASKSFLVEDLGPQLLIIPRVQKGLHNGKENGSYRLGFRVYVLHQQHLNHCNWSFNWALQVLSKVIRKI